MTLTDLLDADPEQINQESISTQLENILNSYDAALENLESSVDEMETQNKDDFDIELKITVQDLLLYAKKCEFLLQIAKAMLTEYKNQQGWVSIGSPDQDLLTVYEELVDREGTLDLEYTLEMIHLGITGEDLLAYINEDVDMDDVSEGGLDISLSEVDDDEFDITAIENTKDSIKKKLIWQANLMDVIGAGLLNREIIDELNDVKYRAFDDITFEYYSEHDLMEEIEVEDLNISLDDWDDDSPDELEVEDIELDDIFVEDALDDDG